MRDIPHQLHKTFRRWYVYILAGFGLVWLAVSLVQLINAAVNNLPVWGDTLVRGQFWNNTAQMSIAQILLGGITWYFHWFRMAKDDFDSALRQVYFYLLTISGGAITALVAGTILLYRLFIWVFGGTLYLHRSTLSVPRMGSTDYSGWVSHLGLSQPIGTGRGWKSTGKATISTTGIFLPDVILGSGDISRRFKHSFRYTYRYR